MYVDGRVPHIDGRPSDAVRRRPYIDGGIAMGIEDRRRKSVDIRLWDIRRRLHVEGRTSTAIRPRANLAG